jgi:hypothetical protein
METGGTFIELEQREKAAGRGNGAATAKCRRVRRPSKESRIVFWLPPRVSPPEPIPRETGIVKRRIHGQARNCNASLS